MDYGARVAGLLRLRGSAALSARASSADSQRLTVAIRTASAVYPIQVIAATAAQAAVIPEAFVESNAPQGSDSHPGDSDCVEHHG